MHIATPHLYIHGIVIAEHPTRSFCRISSLRPVDSLRALGFQRGTRHDREAKHKVGRSMYIIISRLQAQLKERTFVGRALFEGVGVLSLEAASNLVEHSPGACENSLGSLLEGDDIAEPFR